MRDLILRVIKAAIYIYIYIYIHTVKTHEWIFQFLFLFQQRHVAKRVITIPSQSLLQQKKWSRTSTLPKKGRRLLKKGKLVY